MKGHAKIELTNVKTGEVQVIEEDNIVTDYLPELLRPHYPFVSNWNDSFDFGTLLHDSASLNPWITPYQDFGGLLMFKESLESDPAKYHPDESLTMVAHASDDVYIGADMTRGSFNKPLSGYSTGYLANEDSPFVRLVWDFGMEQGNGTIGTVCLCNHNDGKIGFGSKHSVSCNWDEQSFLFHHSQFTPVSNFGAYVVEKLDPELTTKTLHTTPTIHPIFYDSANGRMVCIDETMVYGDSLRFVVIDTNSNSIQPINSRASYGLTSSSVYASSCDDYFKTYQYYRSEAYYYPLMVTDIYPSATDSFASTYGIPIDFYTMLGGVCPDGTYWYFNDASYVKTTSKFYISSFTGRWTWNAGTVKTLTKIDLRTMETKEFTVTNTTGVDLKMLGRPNLASLVSGLLVYKNYLIFRNSDGRLYRINLDNNSDVSRATWLDDETPLSVSVPANYTDTGKSYVTSNFSYLPSIFQYVLGNRMYFATGNSLSYTYDSTVQLRVLDLDTFVAKYVSAPARAQYPNGAMYNGQQNINGYSGNLLRPFCVSDCDIVPVRSAIGSSTSWTTTNKFIYHRIYFKHFFKPMGLITINTLSEPVTKTADMTMRITYTLTA